MNEQQHSNFSAGFEGLALHDHLALSWQPMQVLDPADIEQCNHETARALQALTIFEESPKDLPPDLNHPDQALVHLEAKVDVLVSLITRLVMDRQGAAQRHSTVLRADGIEWAGPDAEKARTGDSGIIVLYPNPNMPLPFRLPGKVVGSVERGGSRWRLTRFEHLSGPVKLGLEKMVFRRHRRQVALSKGTDIFTKTGIHRVSKF
jgi:hypothetical protein